MHEVCLVRYPDLIPSWTGFEELSTWGVRCWRSPSISYFLGASIGPMKVRHIKYAPRAARVTPPTKATPKILVSQKSSSTTKYRPAMSIVTELINMLTFLMLRLLHHVPALTAESKACVTGLRCFWLTTAVIISSWVLANCSLWKTDAD